MFLVLVVAMVVLLPGVVDAPDATESAHIEDHQTLSLAPDADGYVNATHTYTLPADLTRFEITVPAGAIVTATEGLTRSGDRTYEWDGDTSSPRIRYQAAVDRTSDREDPIAGPGEYLFKDGGDWALILRPQLTYGWSWTGDATISISREASVDGPGAVSDRIVFLGEHKRHTHEAHGQQFVLIDPEQADLAEAPEDIFSSLEHASDVLRVGDRDETVFMVAAPTDETQWGARGLQTGEADFWVRDVEALDDPDNVWIHEYVHTRQDYTTHSSARWFTEASASYYAALLTYDEGRIDFETFQSWLKRGDHEQYDGVALVDPTTWRHHADYVLGPLIAAELDRQLRFESGSTTSFADVFRQFNEHDERVDHEDVLSFLEASGSDPIADAGNAYLQGTDRPSVWNREHHEDVFGVQPARFATQIEELHVTSAYRDRSLARGETPTLVPEETVSITVAIENRGDVPGTFDIGFLRDDSTIERISGELEPGATSTRVVTYRVSDLGEKRFTVGEARQRVTVRHPADATITDFSVEPSRVDRGETVTVEVAVVNDASYPGRAVIGITRDETVVVERLAHLDAEDSTTVRATVRMSRSGAVLVGVANSHLAGIPVEVEQPAVTDLIVPTAVGAGMMLLLIAGLYILVRRRQSRKRSNS